MLNNIDACIFDLDGTLLDSMHIWKDVDKNFLEKHSRSWDPNLSEKIKKMTYKESAKYFKETYHLKMSEKEIMNEWNEMVLDEYQYHIKLKPGVKDVLKAIAGLNIKMGVATSCNVNHAKMALKRLGVIDYFSFIKTCKEVGKNKEYPDIYLACAKELDSEVENTLVFEDLLMAIKVAKKAGFKTCAILDELSKHEKHDLKQASDYYFDSFKDINLGILE